MSNRTISPQELSSLMKQGNVVEFIDVRTPVEYREIHAQGTKLVPLDQLDPNSVMKNRNGTKENPLYVICRSGSRGKQACEKFHALGYTNVINVEGGTSAWEQAGLPVNRGKKCISLERQVRIVAGLMILTGVALGYFLHSYFFGISAFVGAGLVFAGVTDTCGMAYMLGKMPWNQVNVKNCSMNQPATGTKQSCCG